jgi:hypothetical protein
MVETPNRELGHEEAAINAPSSTVEAKAAIRETRARLAMRLTGTADRVHAIFTRPAVAQTEPRARGVIGSAINTIAAVGRTKRVWRDARSSGLLRRSTIVAVVVAVALVLATRTKRHAP